jgi:hypothetical protein
MTGDEIRIRCTIVKGLKKPLQRGAGGKPHYNIAARHRSEGEALLKPSNEGTPSKHLTRSLGLALTGINVRRELLDAAALGFAFAGIHSRGEGGVQYCQANDSRRQ